MISDPLDACRFWAGDEIAPHTFSDPQIQEFLDMAKVPDADGYKPQSVYYTPTYDVFKAAAFAWLKRAQLVANKPTSYKMGDVTITIDKNYCKERVRDLMGSRTATATRRDEPGYELYRETAYDGDNPRHRT